LWARSLAHNLTRQSMLRTACVHDERPEQLSIAASMQFLANSWLPAARASTPSIEPHATKRRPTKHDLLTRPRAQACARWIARRSSSLVTLHKAVPVRPGTFVSPVVSIIAAGCNNSQSPNLPVAMTEEFQWNDTARAFVITSGASCDWESLIMTISSNSAGRSLFTINARGLSARPLSALPERNSNGLLPGICWNRRHGRLRPIANDSISLS